MSVFRVEKNKGYTVMSNHHLRNHALSLKAKGLLSQMLSLPDDWDYTLQGLAPINKESIDAIREAVRELERAGYIKRSRERDERGCLRGTVYTIYEQPHAEPTPEKPTQALPTLDNPTLEKPMLDLPTLENPTQLNTESTKKRKRQNKDPSITDSFPFPSGFPESPTQKRTETKGTFESYRELILENIDYDVLVDDPHVDREQLDEIVDLVQETVCSTRSRIRISGNDYPAEVVRSKLLKLNGEHIRFVVDCLKQNTTRIRNIRQYLLTALFNAPSTMNSYYTALVAHDIFLLHLRLVSGLCVPALCHSICLLRGVVYSVGLAFSASAANIADVGRFLQLLARIVIVCLTYCLAVHFFAGVAHLAAVFLPTQTASSASCGVSAAFS